MTENIKCPNCGHEFEPTDTIRDEIQKELRSQMEDWKKKKEKEFDDQKMKQQQQIEESTRKRIASDYENKLNVLLQEQKENQEKLKEARQKEADYLRKEMEL